MKFSIPAPVAKAMAHKALTAQKHSPTLLLAAGVVGVVASTVMACRATLQLDEILEADQQKLKDIRVVADQNEDYNKNHKAKDLTVVYTRSAVAISKLYAPSVVLGAVSLGCLVGSHRILTTRNAGLMAAYATLEKGFDEYRDKVVRELGLDKERELRFGTEVVEETGDDGKVRTSLKAGSSIYARFFDEASRNWVKTASQNQLFLRCQQQYANDLLKTRGHLFLNEVYDMLGLERSKEGALVGWIVDGNGDEYVDFGIFDGDLWSAMRFVNGDERTVLLDFNVDGVIYDKI
jgi:hypothetical protein